MTWWQAAMTVSGTAPDDVLAEMTSLIREADGGLLKVQEFRDVSFTTAPGAVTFRFTLEAPFLSAAWITALATVNRVAGRAGFPPGPMTAMNVSQVT
jgi:hypothetical protein